MRKILWSFFEFIETVAIALVAVFLIRNFIAQPFLVSGTSMEPNFGDGNYLLIDELTYRFRAPERGEVIVFKYPQNPKSYYIKRVIGLPGEKVVIDGGKVTIYSQSGEKVSLNEGYLTQQSFSGHYETQLDSDKYFVMGDNRNFSFDSRSWGSLPVSRIIGVVRLRLWPISEAMAFSAPAY